jgi:hypothetical protein
MIESESGIEDHLPDLLHIWVLHEAHVLRQLAQSFSSHPTHFTRHPSHVLAVQSAQVSPHAEHSLVTDPMRGHELHSTMQALHLFSSVLNWNGQQHSMQHTLLQSEDLVCDLSAHHHNVRNSVCT